MRTEIPAYQYRVDAVDRLIWLDPWWLGFARENGAADLTAEKVLGRSLWDFIADSTTRKLYQGVHERLRKTRKFAIFPFRCDSPTLKRQMRLTISCGEADALDYVSTLLHVQPITHQKFLEPGIRRSAAHVTMCSCCKQCLVESHGWLEPDEVVRISRVFDSKPLPGIRYAVCPHCTDALSATPDDGTAA